MSLTDDIENSFMEIDSACNSIYDFEIKIYPFRKKLDEEIESLFNIVKDQHNEEIANRLYWHDKMNIAAEVKATWYISTGKEFVPIIHLKTFECEKCGKMFQIGIKSRGNHFVYKLCPDCKPHSSAKPYTPETREFNCYRCGQPFARLTSKYNWVYCPECYKTIQTEKRVNESDLWKDQSTGEEVISKERLHELKIMPYKEYLQTPEWAKTRKAAYKRAGKRCQLCNTDGLLHIHHRTYERRGEELPEDLFALCPECHRKFHGIDESG